jgi:hypothetical protein
VGALATGEAICMHVDVLTEGSQTCRPRSSTYCAGVSADIIHAQKSSGCLHHKLSRDSTTDASMSECRIGLDSNDGDVFEPRGTSVGGL